MYDNQEYAERPNKTKLKAIKKQHHNLGKQLVEMANSKFDKIPMSDRMRGAILEAKRLQKGALKRQLKYISGLMEHEDIDTIQLEIKRQNLPDKQATEAFHQLEQWRDRLIAGDNAVMEELISTFPQIDRQHIRQLVRNAAKEAKLNKPPKSARSLFQYLKALQEA